MPIGNYPVVLGHEGVGIVRWIGSSVSNRSLAVGDTVCLSFHTCRQCKNCRSGKGGGCPNMTQINFLSTSRRDSGPKSPISLPDGTRVHGQFFGQSSLSKLAVVTEKCLVKLDARPDELQYLAPMGCGYLTGAGTIFNVLQPQVDDSIMVIGLGAVGFAAILAARALGVRRIVVVDLLEEKLKWALSLGATDTINNSTKADLAANLRGVLPDGADKILDATGVAGLLESSIKCLAHGGTLALVGVPTANATLNINTLDLLLSCKRVIGVIEGLADPEKVYTLSPWSRKQASLSSPYRQLIPQLFRLYRNGQFPIDHLSKIYPAHQLAQAIQDLKSGLVSFFCSEEFVE